MDDNFYLFFVSLHQQKCDLGVVRQNERKKKQMSETPMGIQYS